MARRAPGGPKAEPGADAGPAAPRSGAALTTQGRAVGYCVVAALQDPRKDVLTIRNLFSDRIAMRLDEPEQVDIVLGDGARDRGAACELIPSDPATGAGVAFVQLEGDPDPVRCPRRMGHRLRHPRPGRCVHPGSGRVAGGGGMTTTTAWRTDEPCPVCATGLILHDDGTSPAWAECRLCGWADTWTGDEPDGGDQ